MNESGNIPAHTINLQDEHEKYYWTKILQVTLDDIQEAIDKVGASAEEVKFYLWDEPRNNGNNPYYFFE